MIKHRYGKSAFSLWLGLAWLEGVFSSLMITEIVRETLDKSLFQYKTRQLAR